MIPESPSAWTYLLLLQTFIGYALLKYRDGHNRSNWRRMQLGGVMVAITRCSKLVHNNTGTPTVLVHSLTRSSLTSTFYIHFSGLLRCTPPLSFSTMGPFPKSYTTLQWTNALSLSPPFSPLQYFT